ncbi:MAG: hypothetical protein M0Z48_11400 [Nitrospiraceae bacterium]|nr:hypothetical protein [Nitrospiraceae bacterium]
MKKRLPAANRILDTGIARLRNLTAKAPTLDGFLRGRGLRMNRLTNRIKSSFADSIDLRRSAAFAMDHSSVGHIYINHEGRRPSAPVKKAGLFSLRREIARRPRKFIVENGRFGRVDIYFTGELYPVPRSLNMPDILFVIDDMASDVSAADSDILAGPNPIAGKSGAHRGDGVFMAAGPSIRRAAIGREINLVDMAPTILHLLGTGVPEDMDGTAITEILKTETHGGKIPGVGIKGIIPGAGGRRGGGPLPEDEAVKEQLRGLGYLCSCINSRKNSSRNTTKTAS